MSVLYTDANGFQTIQALRTAFGATTIAADIQSHSNAMQSTTWEGAESAPVGAPTAAQYLPGNVKARLTFQCADLTEVSITIPAPKIGIFYADGKTVDPTKIAVLIADCLANLVSTSNSPATSYISGNLLPAD